MLIESVEIEVAKFVKKPRIIDYFPGLIVYRAREKGLSGLPAQRKPARK